MSDEFNGSSSKAPTSAHPQDGLVGNGGFIAQTKMDVRPPKEDDLQKSYASVVGNDPNPKGWYGGMSMFASWI